MDPAEALADKNPRQADDTPAPAVAAWLAHPSEPKAKPLTQAQLLALELGLDLDSKPDEELKDAE